MMHRDKLCLCIMLTYTKYIVLPGYAQALAFCEIKRVSKGVSIGSFCAL